MKKYKIAYIHDWLVVNGGAEKVAQGILELYPEADVFSLIDFLDEKDRLDILQGKKAKVTFIQNLPFAKKLYRYYLPLFPYAIEQLDLRGYDVVISSSYSVAKGVLTSPDQVHICYCHSPVRYAWDLYFDYLEDQNLRNGPKAWFVKRTLHKLRMWDYLAAQRVDYFIANSENVAKRIRKTYRRDAEVIYPPVNISNFTIGKNIRSDYYVTASRMVPYKKMDIIIEAFNKMPDKKLIVLGDGPELKKLKKLSKGNIQLKGYCNLKELIDYIQRAKAFVFAAKEDFGIVPVEAMATGTPVIAYNKGGALETVTDKTGVFFNEQTPESIIDAINSFETRTPVFSAEKVRENAERFSKENFQNSFSNFFRKVVEND